MSELTRKKAAKQPLLPPRACLSEEAIALLESHQTQLTVQTGFPAFTAMLDDWATLNQARTALSNAKVYLQLQNLAAAKTGREPTGVRARLVEVYDRLLQAKPEARKTKKRKKPPMPITYYVTYWPDSDSFDNGGIPLPVNDLAETGDDLAATTWDAPQTPFIPAEHNAGEEYKHAIALPVFVVAGPGFTYAELRAAAARYQQDHAFCIAQEKRAFQLGVESTLRAIAAQNARNEEDAAAAVAKLRRDLDLL